MTTREAGSILIVDDELNMRETLADILESHGYRVSTAATGDAAVAMCVKNSYQVVLMDVRMPGLNGVEAFRQIRKHQEGVRVILMSAYSIEDLKHAALEEGAVAFLAKPLDVENLIRLIGENKNTAILVVDDDKKASDRVSEKLKGEGYWVRTAQSPHEALELVEQIRFDVVFIDASLPAMNGLELYLAIKRITTSAVSIMMTGMEREFEAIAQEAVRRTAYTIVRKPLDLDYILSLLNRITSQRVSNALRKPSQ